MRINIVKNKLIYFKHLILLLHMHNKKNIHKLKTVVSDDLKQDEKQEKSDQNKVNSMLL